MTAEMEEDLDEISRGESDYQKVLDDFWWDFKKQVESKQPELKNERQKYRDTETDVRCPKYGDKMVLKMGRFGEYYQNPNHPECMYPKNFREYEAALQKAQEDFTHLTKGLKCEECGKDLIVRVSKKSLKAYIACPDYKVGNKHMVKSLKELQGGGSSDEKPKRSFRKKKK
jgi:DNA topoisomerase-1